MPHRSGLLTDLYELTMAAGYIQTGFNARATFELWVRRMPPQRSYLVVAGLEQALEFLENIRYSPEEIEYLRRHPLFPRVVPEFFDYLARFRFTGDVWAIPEGALAFPGEPLLRITAPIAEGQIVETAMLAALNFPTLVASKAARVVTAARGRQVIEFGTRRAHGLESGLLAARAAYIGGCQGTSNALAGHRFGIPTYGTQAHSWIMAHEDEAESFRRFLDAFPENAILLVDTYDVRAAVEKVIAIGRKPRGLRLDSGDVAADSVWIRRRLNQEGWGDVRVFASGDLDEERIEDLLDRGAQIEGFGVGTALSTSADAPTLSVVYKLVEMERGGQVSYAAKFSPDKVTYPARKQVFRFADPSAKYQHDLIALEGESPAGGQPLLLPVMRGGKRVQAAAPVAELRQRCLVEIERLPERYRRLDATEAYPVRYSDRLEALLAQARERLAAATSRSAR